MYTEDDKYAKNKPKYKYGNNYQKNANYNNNPNMQYYNSNASLDYEDYYKDYYETNNDEEINEKNNKKNRSSTIRKKANKKRNTYNSSYDNSDNNQLFKQKYLVIIIILVIILGALVLILYNSMNVKTPPTANNSNFVRLYYDELELKVGETRKLDLILSQSNDNYRIEWFSNNDNVVTVDNNGNVKAIKEGEAIVLVAYYLDNKIYDAQCYIYVSK